MKTTRLITAAAVATLASMAAPASAQNPAGFDIQNFSPAPNQWGDAWTTHAGRVPAAKEWGIHLVTNFADNPLVLRSQEGDVLDSVVGAQVTTNIMGFVGIANRLELAVDIPLVLFQSGESLSSFDVFSADDAQFGIGDVRLFLKGMLFGQPSRLGEKGAALSIYVDSRFPTGNPDVYQGDNLRIEPGLAFDYRFRRGTNLALNAGYQVRSESTMRNLEVDDLITWSIASSILADRKQRFAIVPEITGGIDIGAADREQEEIQLEALLGLKYLIADKVLVSGGAGTGLTEGFGNPDWRAFVGIGYHRSAKQDRDEDGLCNSEDTCPNEPEDKDGFEDFDGCADLDNDQDGILDLDDGPDGTCANNPEDKDGFQDADGCPDPDNDQDGVLDVVDGLEAACANDPEDMDEFEDFDGCPDPDNDKDGVLDVIDGLDGACKNEPEDVDGFQDPDGCPEPDNDRDGLLDGLDTCPVQAEDLDGFEDSDGCPEDGAGQVTVTCDRIEIADSVYFETDSDVIRERSFPLLDQVASTLR